MTLTGEQERELRDAICDAFDVGELAQLVRYRLGETLESVVESGPLQSVVFNLINAYRRRGRVDELVRAIFHERPRNPLVVAFCERHAKTAVEPASKPAKTDKPHLDSPHVEQRLLALARIALDRDETCLHRVMGLLQTETNARIRERAAWTLDCLNRREAVPNLIQALEDPEWGVRSNAGWALVHLGQVVRDEVQRVLNENPNPDAREMARLVLERL
jgi:hypothetical protein